MDLLTMLSDSVNDSSEDEDESEQEDTVINSHQNIVVQSGSESENDQ